jgi:hypothetical protein
VANNPKLVNPSPIRDEREDFRILVARMLERGAERVHADIEGAQQLRIIDGHGNLLSKELPADMQPDAEYIPWEY